MIWIHEMGKTYREGKRRRQLFSRVNLLLPTGVCIGILGASGSGKSTLLKMLAGAELPSEGRIEIQGRVLWAKGVTSAMHPQMTLRQNLRFLSRLYIADDLKMDEVVDNIIQDAGLGEYRDEVWNKIPANEKKLLNPSVLLHLPVDWLLLDGALGPGKNEVFRKRMLQRVRSISTLFASSNEKQLKEACDAGVVIFQGQLHYFDSIAEAVRYNKTINGAP